MKAYIFIYLPYIFIMLKNTPPRVWEKRIGKKYLEKYIIEGDNPVKYKISY